MGWLYRVSDKRMYSRIEINVDCLVYIENKEIQGQIRDISEDGMCISVSKKDATVDDFQKNASAYSVVIVDNGQFHRFSVISVRVIDNENDNILVGAKIRNQSEIEKYVTDKKVSAFFENI